MVLENTLKEQLKQYMDFLTHDVVITASLDDSASSKRVEEFLVEVASLSEKLTIERRGLSRTPSFELNRSDEETGITFAGLPLGHEFESFVLALIQVSGRPPKIEPKFILDIEKINRPLYFETYVSLTCHNCPEVVQALNVMSVLNPNVRHTMIEGGMFEEEVKQKQIMAVPTVFLNGEEFASGRQNLEELLSKVVGQKEASAFSEKEPYDVLVVGGGPAGSAAAIYAARKGIRTGLVAEKFGGQPLETLGIENIIGTKYTQGPKFMGEVEAHIHEYPVDVMNLVRVTKVAKRDLVEVTLENGAVLKSKTAILSTGAKWRDLNIPGEKVFKNKGVAYCPHCDGPLFAGKDVAVIGGGNSGIEAAIDLAGVTRHVSVLEFLPELKADKVLQERLASLPNVTVLTNVETKAITGDSAVKGLDYVHRETGVAGHLDVEGVFVLIGLVPNTQFLKDSEVALNARGEILVDKNGATNVAGIFAAGDCTDSTYKQIVISIGSGAVSSLAAFDFLIRQA